MSGLARITVEVRNGDIAKALKKFKKKGYGIWTPLRTERKKGIR